MPRNCGFLSTDSLSVHDENDHHINDSPSLYLSGFVATRSSLTPRFCNFICVDDIAQIAEYSNRIYGKKVRPGSPRSSARFLFLSNSFNFLYSGCSAEISGVTVDDQGRIGVSDMRFGALESVMSCGVRHPVRERRTR